MAVVHIYHIPGTMTRVENGWCDKCRTPSIWTGPVWRLSPDHVCLYGQVTGCHGCDDWQTVPKN